jgi:hypothetical protein
MVQAGSRLEINSTFYQINDNDEQIIGDPVDGAVNYVYAVPQPSSAIFQYGVQEPHFDAMKGGWFSGTMRAVARMVCFDGGFYDKVILDSVDAMLRHNNSLVPISGGELIGEGPVNDLLTLVLFPGVYRYEMKGGKGGTGGTGYGGVPAEAGEDGEINNGSFPLYEPINVTLSTGGNGANGGNGTQYPGSPPFTQTTYTNSGGGASGGQSFIDVEGKVYLEAIGGAGSKGTSGSGGSGSAGGQKISSVYASAKRIKPEPSDQMQGRSKYGQSFNFGSGAGGSSLLDTSSGYCRLYRLWDL